MERNDWAAVLKNLECGRGPVRPVAPEKLTEFERSTGFQLPASYRGFCTTIGAGELDGFTTYQIRVPGARVPHFDLLKFKEKVPSRVDGYDRFKQDWFFASDVSNGLYFWRVAEPTGPGEHEYAIYLIKDDPQPKRLADTFWDFMTNVCLVFDPEITGNDFPTFESETAVVGQ